MFKNLKYGQGLYIPIILFIFSFLKPAFSQTSIISDYNPTNYQLAFLNNGDEYYIDREFVLTSIPSALQGFLWIKTAQADKTTNGLDFWFDLTESATVYVAYDPRLVVPSWLSSGFIKTSHTIQVDDKGLRQFDVWSASFSAGRVTLGDNGHNESNPLFVSHYVVLIDGGTGPPLEADIDVSPSPLDFGNVNVGNSSCQTFVVTNRGNATLSVSNTSIVGNQPGEFSESAGAFILSPGNSQNVSVCFVPTSEGNKSATLRFDNNDPDENPKDISLSGTGTKAAEADIEVSPPSWDFGKVNVDGSACFTFEVRNRGNASLDVSSTSLAGTHASEFSIEDGGAFTLSPGSFKEVEVCFMPTTDGNKSATLRFISNDPNSNDNPKNVDLSGIGETGKLQVTPPSVDFGKVPAGTSSDTTLILTNTGDGSLSVSNISISGTHNNQFSIEAGGVSFSISSGSSRNLGISFTPISEGIKSALLSIFHNGSGSPFTVSLTGLGEDVDVDPPQILQIETVVCADYGTPTNVEATVTE